MKLSEAILIGSTVLTPRAGGQHFAETQSGCALGMAAIANGCTFHTVKQFDERDRRTLGTEGVWGNWVLQKVARPCDCWRIWIAREMRIKDIITHLFDWHVMVKKNWTLERLVAWVETVEPKNFDPSGNMSPEILERLSQIRVVSRSQDEEDREDADEWQAAGLRVPGPEQVTTGSWRSLRSLSAGKIPTQAELGRGPPPTQARTGLEWAARPAGRPPRFGDPSGARDFQLDS